MSKFKFNISPRFRSRRFINKFYFSIDIRKSEVFELLNKITQKDTILDYIQLRIGLLHFLNEVLPINSFVATTSYTIFDLINVIISSGKNPIFVDIDKNNLGPDLTELKQLVISKKVNCVIYTYLHGYKTDLSEFANICKEHNCILIEDCAQSLWSLENKICPGFYGDAALFSTGLFKNINTISGGLLCINSKEYFSKKIIDSHKKLKNNLSKEFINRFFYALFFKFITSKLVFPFITFPILKFGFINDLEFINKRAREENNPKIIYRDQKSLLRMNNIQKLLLMMKTKKSISQDFQKKKFIAELYLKDLKLILEKKLIIIPGLNFDYRISNLIQISSNNQIPILCNNRQDLLKFLIKNNIDIAAQHIRNLTNCDIYKKYVNQVAKNSDEISKKIILLPCYPDYPRGEIKKITNLLNQFYFNNFNCEV